jgi:serine/threonine kinase PknH
MSDVAQNPRDPAAPPPPDLPQGPLESYPPDGGSPRPSRTPIVIMGVVTAVAVLALAGVLLYPVAFPARQHPSQPIAEAALMGLWLSPEQINTAMGASEMTVSQTSGKEYNSSAAVATKDCLPMVGPVEARVYAASGWTAASGQTLREPGKRTHLAEQFVVLFPSPHDADAFFTSSAQKWAACANGKYTYTETDKSDFVWSVGPVSNTNGTLSATKTQEGGDGWACQRALTKANNVVIDVAACAYTQPDSAVKIAQQTAAKVTT